MVCAEVEKAADAVSAIFFYRCAIFWFFKQFLNGFCLFCEIVVVIANFHTILSNFSTYFLCQFSTLKVLSVLFFFGFFYLWVCAAAGQRWKKVAAAAVLPVLVFHSCAIFF